MTGSFKVELLGVYSNTPRLLKSFQTIRALLADLPDKADQSTLTSEPSPAYKLSQRLDLETIERIVVGYQAGSPSTQLAKTHRLSKGSILRLLHQHDVTMRQQRLTRTDLAEAILLYGSGLSLQAVGDLLGRNHSTIHRALQQAGVTMRDTHGRVR